MVECAAVEASHNTSAPFFSSLVSSRPSCGYSFSSFTDPTVLAAHLTVSFYSPPHPKAPFDALSTTALLLLPSPLPEHCLTTLSFASSAVFLLSLASQSLAEHRFTVEARVVKLLSTSLRQRVFFDGFRGTLEASEDSFKAAFKTRSNSCSASFEMKCLPVRDAFAACVRRDNEDYPFVIAAEEEKVVDFTPLPRTGCLAFDITCLSVNLSPFTLRLRSDRHACSYDSIQGIQLDGEKPLLYGDACTEHDVLTFFIDSPQDRFHAFLEGRRIGYSYLEDFGTPAWRAHSMPLHDALTCLQLAVRPFNRVAFDPNILFLPEMPDEEWARPRRRLRHLCLRARGRLRLLHCLAARLARPLPLSSLQPLRVRRHGPHTPSPALSCLLRRAGGPPPLHGRGVPRGGPRAAARCGSRSARTTRSRARARNSRWSGR